MFVVSGKILIGNIWLENFGGSELVAIELAEYYAKHSWEVYLYSPKISDRVRSSIEKRYNLTVSSEYPDLNEYDIIWSHHGLFLDKINKKTRRENQKIISNHMSSWVNEEMPKFEPDTVDLMLANSLETKDKLLTINPNYKIELFQNPAPPLGNAVRKKDPWFVFDDTKKPKVAAISNHRPPELEQFISAHFYAFNFVKFGARDSFRRISPKMLYEECFDFVICNGKSVQYAMEAGLPVFLYDQFKGCGWLNEKNFHQAEHYNFSGRGFKNLNSHPFLILSWLQKKEKAITQPLFGTRFRLGDCLSRRGLI